MPDSYSPANVIRDVRAGLVVFLVALPLCLGIAVACGAPPMSGLLAGMIGGIVVGLISGSHTSVSGPAAGLTSIVAPAILTLGDFPAFLLAVTIAGLIQVLFGLLRAGFLAEFIPNGVIKGLLCAIGVIIILKQLPHVVGYDKDPEGDLSFFQHDSSTTFSALFRLTRFYEPGALVIGVVSTMFLFAWGTNKKLKNSLIPAPLIVVVFSVIAAEMFKSLGEPWMIDGEHLVRLAASSSASFFMFPDFSRWNDPLIWNIAFTIAAVASLETLLNLEAVDKIDNLQRKSPPSRELVAQGIGNTVAGLIGGLPITSVIVRSSANVNAGARTKMAAIFHGLILLFFVVAFPSLLARIPISALAAILFVTGYKLVDPKQIEQLYYEGWRQFLPFAVTVIAIVLSNPLEGGVIGLAIAIAFILQSNLRRPLHILVEKHLSGEVVHIELANQVSFLNRAALTRALETVPRGGHLLLDARRTDYIDPDILDLLHDFKQKGGPARGIRVSLRGFKQEYKLEDSVQFVDHSTRELQEKLTPLQVLEILKEGNERFRTGRRLTRDFGRQLTSTSHGQHPIAVVLSCIDSRSPAELIFDLGLGDIFSVRVAGNIVNRDILGSMEFGCSVAGAKLILVMGHTRCGAVKAAFDLLCTDMRPAEATGCVHLEEIVREIQVSVDPSERIHAEKCGEAEKERAVNDTAKRNVERMVTTVREKSHRLRELEAAGKILIVGALYDVVSGGIDYFPTAEATA